MVVIVIYYMDGSGVGIEREQQQKREYERVRERELYRGEHSGWRFVCLAFGVVCVLSFLIRVLNIFIDQHKDLRLISEIEENE